MSEDIEARLIRRLLLGGYSYVQKCSSPFKPGAMKWPIKEKAWTK